MSIASVVRHHVRLLFSQARAWLNGTGVLRASTGAAAPTAQPGKEYTPADAPPRRPIDCIDRLIHAGYHVGPVPYGYRADVVRAATGAGPARTRLVPDPPHDAVVRQIFTWRVDERVCARMIAARLQTDPVLYPPPGIRWTPTTVAAIIANPRYTGYQVWGYREGSTALTPLEEWIVSACVAHEPLVKVGDFAAAQYLAHANIRNILRRLPASKRRAPTSRRRAS